MPSTTDLLRWESMSRIVDEQKTSLDFLFQLIFAREQITLPTETVGIDVLQGDREMAPFSKVGGPGILMGGDTDKRQTIELPHIRIKRPMEASSIAYRRQPGTAIFPTRQEQRQSIQQYIARQTRRLRQRIDNRKEWLAAMALRGQVSYSGMNDNWTLTFARNADHDIALTGTRLWDDNGTSQNLVWDFALAHELMSEGPGVSPDICILGKVAARYFMKIMETKQGLMDFRRLSAGEVTFRERYMRNGARYLGTFQATDVWTYPRQVIDEDGSRVDLIRPNYAEFISLSPEAEHVTYYGAIADEPTFGGNVMQMRTFAKSWTEPDPPVRMELAATRPLCVLRRPDTTLSMKVTAATTVV